MQDGQKSSSLKYEKQVSVIIDKITGLHGVIYKRKKYKGKESDHEIDISLEYMTGEIRLLFIVECKDWKRPVQKRDVQAFVHTLKDIGANKGIMVSRAGFQKGAIAVAKANGIALLIAEAQPYQTETLMEPSRVKRVAAMRKSGRRGIFTRRARKGTAVLKVRAVAKKARYIGKSGVPTGVLTKDKKAMKISPDLSQPFTMVLKEIGRTYATNPIAVYIPHDLTT